MPFILYARRSQEREERQIQSIEDQITRTRQLALSRGLIISEEIPESRSAKEPDQRPGFSRMIRLIETGKADGILAWHPDRLSRNELEAARITYLVRKGRLSLHFVNYSFDPSPEGIMMLQMALSQSQYYSSKLAKDVWRGMSSKIEKGWCPFRAPEGYRNDAETRTIVADPERFPLIRQAWDRLLTGAYTVPEVVRLLNGEWGYTTRPSKHSGEDSKHSGEDSKRSGEDSKRSGEDSKRSGEGAKRGGGPLSLPSAYKLFHNPYYAGYFRVNGITYQGKHPPMVTAAEFERAQELLARAGGRRQHKNVYAFAGMINCARCGCRISPEMQPGRYKPGRYVYYHCINRKRVCSTKYLREEELEAQIDAVLQSVTIEQKVADFALAAVDKWTADRVPDGEAVSHQQEDALKESARQLGALLDLKLRGMVADSLFESKQAELQERVATLQRAQERTAGEFVRVQSSARNAIRFMAGARAKFLVGTAEEKREITRGLGVTFSLALGVVHIETHPALMPHLLIEAAGETVLSGKSVLSGKGSSDVPKIPESEHELIGSGSTKKAAFAAAFSCGGPTENYAERLRTFFSVKPSFPEATCLGTSTHL